MNLKMKPNSLFAILLRSPWWISFGLVGLVALLSMALLPQEYRAVGVMGGFPFLVIGCIAAWRQWQAPSPARLARALELAQGMSWPEFSTAIEQSFGSQGYAVSRLSGKAADFQLLKAGHGTLVCSKRWKAANHGVEALRELVCARVARNAAQCMYISLGEVSDTARRFAQEHGVELVSGQQLAVLLCAARLPTSAQKRHR